MTSSFGITPQRQIRDLVATPEAPVRPAAPAQPAQEPQRLGGQLMYSRQFQPDTKTEQGLRSIEAFLGEKGVFQGVQGLLFERYKEDKKRQARQLLEQEATALFDTEENAKDIKALQAKGNDELARQTRLSNPWVNFFYYDTKATNAGQQAAVELAAWAKSQAGTIAEIDDPAERASVLARKAQQILAQYSDIPEAFKAAKIDPLMAATQADIKADVANKVFERKERTIKQTGAEILLGKWRLGAQFNKAEGTTEFSSDLLKAGVLEMRDWLINKNGYGKQQATDALFELFDKDAVFLDVNGDQLNDIGSTYNAYNMLRSLGELTVDGVKLTDLRDSKGRNLRSVIEGAVDRATKREELREGSIERGIQRQQREFTRTVKDRSTLWWTENPNATDAQIIQRIREEEAFALEQSRRGYLPQGMSYQGAVDMIRDQYKFSNRLLTPKQGAAYLEQIDDLIAAGKTEMPAYLESALQGTNLYSEALRKFGDARRKDNAADRAAGAAVQKTLLKGLLDGLKGSFMQDPQIKAMDKEKGEVPKQKKAYLNQAIIEAKQRLNAEGGAYLTREINRARAAGRDINDPTVQLEILKKAQTDFYARPEYNDVDRYYNITDYGKLGAKAAAPALGSSRKDSSGRWVIDIKDTDNRAAWSAAASSTYGKNPNLARTALNSQMFFNDVEIGELNKAVITGDLSGLSQAVRQSLNNLSRTAFQGKIPVSEIVERQLKTYYGNQFLPPNLKQRAREIEASVRPVSAATGAQPSDVGIRVTNWHHGHSKRPGGSGNNAIDFTLVRQNGQIANSVPAPISGRVIFAGRDGGFGNSIIIEAASAGPGYNKGDRIRIAHLAQLYWKAGDQITRGRPVGKSGDDSPHDSVPGRSGTGAGDPGHVHIQVYKPGAGVPTQAFQYSQDRQAQFVQQNLVPLFRYKNQTGQERSSINTQVGEQLVGQLQQERAFEDVAMINPMVVAKSAAKLLTPVTKNIYQTYNKLFKSQKPAKSVSTGKPLDQNARIAAAAEAFRNQSTAAGPGGGYLACAWAVNRVLNNAGVKVPWVEAGQESIYIPFIEEAIKKGAGQVVSMDKARPGDIVSLSGVHLGIIIKTSGGRITFLSNSSSNASFSYEGGFDVIRRPRNINTPLDQIEQVLNEEMKKSTKIYRLNPQK